LHQIDGEVHSFRFSASHPCHFLVPRAGIALGGYSALARNTISMAMVERRY